MNFAIFKSKPIKTISDLIQIEIHNKKPNKKIEVSKNDIELIALNKNYKSRFNEITNDYKKEHNKRMRTIRQDRKREFNQMIDVGKNVVADELIFTATRNFFKKMSKKEIERWANICMDFVYEDLGYSKEQIIHSIIHLDEEIPHLHCVVVPIVKKYDKRTKSVRYSITKKQYIRDKIHLSELQDKYHQRLVLNGYDIKRGIKLNQYS